MNVRQLELFAAIMRVGSLTEAARQLNISQPAASKLLRHAEDLLGFKLFLRVRGRLLATPEARALHPDVEQVFSDIAKVRRQALTLRDSRQGALSVAAVPSLAMALLPEALANFSRQRPLVTVTVHVVPVAQIIDMVKGDLADLGLLYAPSQHPALRQDDLVPAEAVCVLPPGHALAAKPALGARDLLDQPLIGSPRTSSFGHLLASLFAAEGLEYRPTVEAANSHMACALVSAGVGIALVDGFARRFAFNHLVERSLAPRLQIQPRLVSPRYRPHSRLASHFLRDLRAASARIAGLESG